MDLTNPEFLSAVLEGLEYRQLKIAAQIQMVREIMLGRAPEVPGGRKRRSWTPEQKAAAAERARKRWADTKAKATKKVAGKKNNG